MSEKHASSPASPSVAVLPRVLLVDDERDLLSTTAALLEDYFDVRAYETPRAAARAVERETFDVLCVDYTMPEMNGVELILLTRAQGCDAGAVLCTGNHEIFREPQFVAARAAKGPPLSVLLKPYGIDELRAALVHAISLSAMKRAVRGVSEATNRR